MTESKICTCPSGDGSLRHPCPAHPALVEQAGGDERAAFRPAQVISYRPGVGEVTIYVAGRVPGYMNIGDTVYVSDRAPVEQPIAALAQPSPAQAEQAEAERPEGPTEDELEAAGLGYPLHKEEAVKLWYSGFRSEVITVLEAWEAIGHDIGMNPDKGELLDSLRYMLEKCEAHDAALARVAELERQQPVAWMHDQPNRVDVIHRDVKDLLQRVPGSSRGIYRPLDVSEHYTIPLYAAPVAQAQHSVPEVSGIGRDFAYPRSVVLYLRTEPTDDDLRAIHDGLRSLAAAPGNSAQHSVPELLEWAVGRWHAEVSLRPLINVHRRALDDTWRQVIRRLGGDTGLLCGPSHDELLAAAPAQGGER
ncbi:hypothetical protein ACM76R_28940 [Pseudomonas aeruginosa]